jgi:putative copper export protein/methionine-rich copper-binding protein CopC/mono/diheme cytochrome c family protein
MLLALLLAMLALPAVAGAHSELVSSDPAANASLASGPKRLSLTFSEAIDPSSANVTLLTEEQVVVPGLGAINLDRAGTTATLTLPHLGTGVYTVSYQVTSADDGHVTSGIFAFLIDPSGTAPPPITPTSSASLSSGLDAVLARWLALATVLAFTGIVVFWLFSARPALAATGEVQVAAPWGPICLAAAATLLGLVVYLALAARPILAAGHTGGHGGSFPFDFAAPFGWTPFAIAMRVAMLGAFAAFLLGVGRWTANAEASRRGRSAPLSTERNWLASMLAAGVLTMAGMSFAGHPAAEGGPLLALMDLAHLLGVTAWIGTLVGLFLLARRARPAVGEALRRHSRLALVAAPVVVLSGVANSPILLGDGRELVASTYGNTLLAKALLFAIALGIGAVNHFLVRSRNPRRALALIGGELAVGALAVLAAANLVSGQPSANRQPELALPAITTAHFYGEGGQSTVHLSVDLPAPGNQRYQVDVANAKDNQPRTDVQRVFLAFRPPPDSDLAAERVQLNPGQDAALFGVTGAYTPVVGDWEVDVIVRRVGARDETIRFTVPVRQPIPAELVPPPDTGIGVPAPLALTWRWLPAGAAGWLIVCALLAGALGAGLLARRRPSRGASIGRAALVVIAVAIGLSVGSRAMVEAANQVPAAAAGERNPLPATADSIMQGRSLYLANCQACHGADGAGNGPTAVENGLVMEPLSGVLPDLSDGYIAYRIKVGTVGSGMPGFASNLSDDSRWEIVNFLRSMAP